MQSVNTPFNTLAADYDSWFDQPDGKMIFTYKSRDNI